MIFRPTYRLALAAVIAFAWLHIGVKLTHAEIVVTGNVSPNTLTNPDWTISSDLSVGNGNIAGGSGSVTADAGSVISARTVRIGRGSTGSVTISGSGTQLQAAPVGIVVGDFEGFDAGAIAAGVGTLQIESGGYAIGQTGIIGNRVNTIGTVNVTGVGSEWFTGGLYVGGNTSSAAGQGTLSISDGGTVRVLGTTKLYSTGTINLLGGTLIASRLDVTEPGGTFNLSGGTLQTPRIVGNLTQASGVLAAQVVDGNLTQTGGSVAPGNSPGTTMITGDYDMMSGDLDIELGGVAQGTQYDFLDVDGQFLIGASGTSLNVSFLDGFENSILASDTFVIGEATGGVFGSFAGLNDGDRISTVGGLGDFQINYTSNTIQLSNFVSAVPEPSSPIALGLCFFIGVIQNRRRCKRSC